ncbi:DUF723 domain-containing protein [Psychrobacter celer]|uniref:DUF723 domain-containing protein n=1 Tax=Psychrobacter celer TaxID=306572 RepID=UPI003FD65A70
MAKYTSKEIVEQFICTHGDTYDYSLVDYIHSQTKVKIICKSHGIFEQLVGMHRKGQGCAKCMYDDKRSNLLDVIAKFKEVHGERYDYSLVIYTNTDTKVKILCSEHGIFEQTPWHHTSGEGCPKCVGKNKSQEDMIALFVQAHGDRYDYSKVKYVGANTKVEIVCSDHGSFHQTPIGHASGKGCIKCSGTYQYNTNEITEKFIAVHGEKYDYSFVDYKNSHEKVKIVCSEHGVFEQTAGSHLAGNGCPKCAGNYLLETNEVVDQFISVHDNRYDYSRVVYNGAETKVNIICRKHGEFSQSPRVHKKGGGCPDCAITIGYTKSNYLEYCNQTDGSTHLYLIKCEDDSESFYKVGIAKKGAINRFDSRSKLPYDFTVIKEVYGSAGLIWDLEKSIHNIMRNFKYKPHIDFSGKTECFSKVPDQVIKLLDDFSKSDQLMFLV